MISVINAKQDFPNSSYAVFLVEQEIELSEKLGVNELINSGIENQELLSIAKKFLSHMEEFINSIKKFL